MLAGEHDNMENIISKEILYKRLTVMSFIILMLGFSLYAFYTNQEFINSFKLYYLKAYTGSINYIQQDNEDMADSVPVLLYHGIVDKPDESNITLDNFKSQMFALKRAGWQTVNIEDFNQFIKGEKDLPDKSFLLTFDDGRKDSYYPVDPILKALDYRAVTFIISKYSIDPGSNYLSTSELDRMNKSGRWDIQSHGKDDHNIYIIDENGTEGHFLTNKLWLEEQDRIETIEEYRKRIAKDLSISKKEIENAFSNEVVGFAYPFGDYGQYESNNPDARKLLSIQSENNYDIGFYQVWGSNYTQNYYGTQKFLTRRIDVNPEWRAEELLSVMGNGLSKDTPYYDEFGYNKGWINGWGDMRFGDGNMTLTPSANETEALAILDGTYHWKNYFLRTKLNFVGTLSILARYQDDSNYISCEYNENLIRIVGMRDGERKIIAENDFVISGLPEYYSVEVTGDKVFCGVNNEAVVGESNNIASDFSRGGIGFKVWENQPGNAWAQIGILEVRNTDNTSYFNKSILDREADNYELFFNDNFDNYEANSEVLDSSSENLSRWQNEGVITAWTDIKDWQAIERIDLKLTDITGKSIILKGLDNIEAPRENNKIKSDDEFPDYYFNCDQALTKWEDFMLVNGRNVLFYEFDQSLDIDMSQIISWQAYNGDSEIIIYDVVIHDGLCKDKNSLGGFWNAPNGLPQYGIWWTQDGNLIMKNVEQEQYPSNGDHTRILSKKDTPNDFILRTRFTVATPKNNNIESSSSVNKNTYIRIAWDFDDEYDPGHDQTFIYNTFEYGYLGLQRVYPIERYFVQGFEPLQSNLDAKKRFVFEEDQEYEIQAKIQGQSVEVEVYEVNGVTLKRVKKIVYEFDRPRLDSTYPFSIETTGNIEMILQSFEVWQPVVTY